MIIIGNNKFAKYFNNSIIINNNSDLPKPVANHPDMNMCLIDDTVFLPKGSEIGEILKENGCITVYIQENLKDKYPFDVRLNCKAVGNTVILNRATISKDILLYCESLNKKIIDVKQGYAACSTLALNEKAFITADKGVFSALTQNGLSPLLIQEGYIEIDEYNYGFIGGASGFVGNTLYFFGDIKNHPDYKMIKAYLDKNSIKYMCFEGKLTDVGGIIEI